MKQTFTENDILRYAYDEVTTEEHNAISIAIRNNFHHRSFYHRILAMKSKMDQIKLNPDESNIEIILEYSQSLSSSLETSH